MSWVAHKDYMGHNDSDYMTRYSKGGVVHVVLAAGTPGTLGNPFPTMVATCNKAELVSHTDVSKVDRIAWLVPAACQALMLA
jgi:hypothetical protein